MTLAHAELLADVARCIAIACIIAAAIAAVATHERRDQARTLEDTL